MSVQPLSLNIALRFSRGRRRSGMVSLISILSTMGIALGVAVLIIGLSAMNGFERELKNRILAVVPHGEVAPVEQPFNDWPQVQQRIAQAEGVAAAAPYILFTGLVESGTKLSAIQLRGVVPAQEAQLSALPQFVLDNAWQAFRAGEHQLILGKGIADELNVTRGDWVTIMIPAIDPSGEMKIAQPKRVRLQITGILQLSGVLDHSFGMVPLSDAQQYLDMGDSVTGIAFKANDVFNANVVAKNAVDASEKYAYYRSWISAYGYMYRDIQLVRSIMYLAMILVIGVACFNIVSTLVMAVKEKRADIAVLRTLGAKDRLIRSVFMWYGLLTGLVGSLFGALVGVIVSLQLTTMIKLIERLLGHQFLSGGVYFIDFLPSELHWLDVVLVLLTSIVLSLVASWYPAKRASRIDPARVLSGQ